MTDRRNFDTLTPEFLISINGEEIPLPAKADVTELSVLGDLAAAGMFSFTLLCWNSAEMGVKWIDDDLFKEGNGVEIEMGYRDSLEKLFEGEITSLEPDFPCEQPPTLTVSGYDRRHRLMGKCKTRTFLNMKDSEIASQIAGDWSLTPEVEDTRLALEYVLQNNLTDFLFLQGRARRIGYELEVTDRTLYFRARKNQDNATITLNREVELLEFSARLSTIGQVEEIFVQGWDQKNKEEWVARVATGSEHSMSGSASGPATAKRAFGDTGSTVVDMVLQNQSEADAIADSCFKEVALFYVEGRGLCIGRTDLRAGCVVEIEGLGTRFSGPYYVTSTEHRFNTKTGYRTGFTCRRNAT